MTHSDAFSAPWKTDLKTMAWLTAVDPMRPFGCCSESRHSIVESCGVAGIPPRRAGNFFLLAQKEVTKKESQKT
ncbi:hypothetical protein, partial [Aquabacterium sp.]|uniref:hypothetical protein n=1 Tax=Aquabacterium sp. TaxID=1872578 RepID=UPI002C88E4E6